jgi:hypothetical protein
MDGGVRLRQLADLGVQPGQQRRVVGEGVQLAEHHQDGAAECGDQHRPGPPGRRVPSHLPDQQRVGTGECAVRQSAVRPGRSVGQPEAGPDLSLLESVAGGQGDVGEQAEGGRPGLVSGGDQGVVQAGGADLDHRGQPADRRAGGGERRVPGEDQAQQPEADHHEQGRTDQAAGQVRPGPGGLGSGTGQVPGEDHGTDHHRGGVQPEPVPLPRPGQPEREGQHGQHDGQRPGAEAGHLDRGGSDHRRRRPQHRSAELLGAAQPPQPAADPHRAPEPGRAAGDAGQSRGRSAGGHVDRLQSGQQGPAQGDLHDRATEVEPVPEQDEPGQCGQHPEHRVGEPAGVGEVGRAGHATTGASRARRGSDSSVIGR